MCHLSQVWLALYVLVAAPWFAMAGCASNQAKLASSGAEPRAGDSAEIRGLLARYETALNAGDVDGVMSVYGAAPVFMPQHMPASVGREAVRSTYAQIFTQIRLAIRFEIDEVEVLGDSAWARTRSSGRVTVLASGNEGDESNQELFILSRESEGWRISRYIFTTTNPPR